MDLIKKMFSMRTTSITLFVIVAVLLTLLPVYAADSLRVYTNCNVEEFEGWVGQAQKATGVKIEWSGGMSSTEEWARIQAEAPNFQADFVWGFMNTHALIGKSRGYFLPYTSPTWADIPEKFRDPEGYWYGFNYWFAAMCVNEKFMKKKKFPYPKSWTDLTNPVYKGEIVMPNPATSGTAFLSISAVMQIFGEEKGWEMFEKLNQNVAQYTSSGTKPSQMVAEGEYALGISWDGAIANREMKGYPIKMVIPEEGTAYSLDSVAILKGCKNMAAAKKLIDWLGTAEAQAFIGEKRSKVTRPGVEGRVKLDPKLIKYDAYWAGENQKRIMNEWRTRFPRK
jgi:iron(III) transport system substrate-binding protein